MKFIYIKYFPLILIGFILFSLIVIRYESRFFAMVKLYWFFKRSFFSYLATAFMLIGLVLLLFSLMDARGPEERIKTQTTIERTIILIDTSASMLAEDVRPSRLQKAAMVAKHFARKAVGHQLSVVVFAQLQKKIVPFTSDLDLIDARLESIKGLRNQNGGSSLSTAIQESIQYFKEAGSATGNLLVLTDGEENGSGLGLDIPDGIRLAMVGIGTTKGGRIPLDDGRGFRFGYKKYKGEDVVTKLNESFFKKTVEQVPSGRYWPANTYSLPSEEIIDFFRTEKKKGEQEQEMVIRPVMMQWIVVPALLCLILSYFFKSIKIFTLSFILIFMPAHAENNELSPDVQKRISEFQMGKLSRLEKLKLADDLSKAGAKEQSISLYAEELPEGKIDTTLPPEVYLNYGTTLLEKGEGEKGFTVYEGLGKTFDLKSKTGKKIKEMMDKNSLVYFKTQEKKQQEQKDQEKKDQEEKKNQSQSPQGKDQKDQGQNGGQKKPSDKSDEGNRPQEKNNNDEGEQEEKNKNDDKENKDDKRESSNAENKPMPQQKIPAKLKQLMSDDRQLQMKMIENNTKDLTNRKKTGSTKDW